MTVSFNSFSNIFLLEIFKNHYVYFILKFLASSISPVLNKLKVKVVSNDECQLSFGNIVHETTLCSIGTSDNTGTCQVRIFKKDNNFIVLQFCKSAKLATCTIIPWHW